MAADARPESPDIHEQLRPGWLPLLNDLAQPRGKIDEYFESVIATLFKEYLLSDDDDHDAPATFAQRFDALYGEVYEPKFNGYNGTKRGWTGYLLVFYRMVFSVALAMDYDEPKQIKVVQLLSELRKLPTHAVKIFVQGEFAWIDSEIWTRDPLLNWAFHGHHPGTMTVKDTENLNSQEKIDDYEADVAAFMSYHTFSARCTAAGFDNADRSNFDSHGCFISYQLEPGEELLDSQIMGLAQWILIAGDVTHVECVKKQVPPPPNRRKNDWSGWDNGNGLVVWKQWGDRLSEIAAGLEKGGDPGFKLFEKNREALTDIVVKARDKVIGLEPDLFTKSEQEPAMEALTDSTKQEPVTEPLADSTKQEPATKPLTDSTKQEPAREPLTDSTKPEPATEPLADSTKQERGTEPLPDSTKQGRIQRLIQQSWGRIQRSLSPKRRA